MPATYEPIATTTLGSAASSITFSSIPGTYTDLRLVVVGVNSSGSAAYFGIRVNGDTATNYSYTNLRGDGSAASSQRATSRSYIYSSFNGFQNSLPGLCEVDIFSYAGSTNKTFLCTGNEDQNGSGTLTKVVGLWRNTGAITSVEVSTLPSDLGGANYTAGTTATLYGILKA